MVVRLMWRWRVVINSKKHRLTQALFLQSQPKYHTPDPFLSPLPDSHLAHHRGTPLPSHSHTKTKWPTQARRNSPAHHCLGNLLSTSPCPATMPALLSSAFHPFLPLTQYVTALTCTFWPIACPTLGPGSWNVQPSNGDTILECSMLSRCVLSHSGWEPALRSQPCGAGRTNDIMFHDSAGILIALYSMSPSILSHTWGDVSQYSL